MPHPHDHACYADSAWCGKAAIRLHEQLARDTWRLRLDCPAIARRVLPGQFVMLRLPDGDDPLLGRPLALYDTVCPASGEPAGIDLVYLVVGKLTSRLTAKREGEQVEIWGPLGNGFAPEPAEHLVMVAGGIGQTPFPAVAREALGLRTYGQPPRAAPAAKRVTLCYGARSAEYLAGIVDFEALGVDVRISTDDGSQGHCGFVTDLLCQLLDEDREPALCRVVCCGPEPMMAAVARITAERGVACRLSLETPMACGLGICFSCVAKVRRPGEEEWDYRRTCVEGPVFDAREVVFD